MSSSLRVNTIVPSTGTNVAIGTANGTVTFTDSVNFVLGTGSSIFSPASNTLTFGTNDAERLRITSGGNVDIGGATHSRNLTVHDATNGVILIEGASNGTSNLMFADENDEDVGMLGYNHASNYLAFTVNAAERLRIDSSGNLLLGTSSSLRGGRLQVASSGAGTEIQITESSDAGGGPTLRITRLRGSNLSSPAPVQANNYMGQIAFDSYDTGAYRVGAFVRAEAEQTWASGDCPTRLILGTTSDGANSPSERIRINSNGRIGINATSPEAMLQVDYDEGSSEVGLRLRAYNASGSKTWQLSEVNGNAGVFSIRNATNSTEGLEIHADGHLRVPTGDLRVGDNTDSNAGTKTISVGSVSSGSGGIGIFANPTNGNSFVQFGDGTSSADQYRGYMNYRHADDSLRFGTAGTDRLHIYANGKIHLGNSHIASNNLTRLHVGWNSGGTVAGESIIAGTLGNDTTAVSALLTMKNAGNRGAQGASGGSSLAKFEFNNGTAFEIDKYGRRTLPYQPACKLTIDTNSTGGGNHAQTGRTILPFNSTGFGYNTGNHYNLTTHTFTCPLNGKYLVILSVNVIGDNIAYIYKNGSIHSAGEFRSNPNGTWEHIEISAVVECSANDTIQPYSQMTGSGRKFNGGNQPGSYWDTLSIYYLG